MTKVMAIVNLLTTNGEELGDQRVVEKVLRSLPTKYEMIVIVILEFKDLTKFSVEALFGSLQSHEAIFNLEDGTGTSEHAFKTKVYMDKGGGRGFGSRKGRGRGHFQSEDKPQVAQFEHSEQSQQDRVISG